MPLRAEILVPVCTAVLIVCYPLGLGFEALKKLHSHGGRTTFSELRTGTIIRLLEYLSRLALSGGGCSGRCFVGGAVVVAGLLLLLAVVVFIGSCCLSFHKALLALNECHPAVSDTSCC